MALTIGWKASQQHISISASRDLWRRVDDSGLDHCWVFDHFRPMGRVRSGDIFEAWTLLAAMAQWTSRVRLGTLVTGNGYRHPGILAKMAATVDHVSGGRLLVGLGAGGDPADEMLGLPVPSPSSRVARLDEAAQILRLLWDSPVASFDGRHYSLTEAVSDPKPVQRPLPLWIASNGEKAGLRIVAQRADAWLTATFDETPGDLVRLCGVLDRHCAEVGRDPASLRRAVQFPLSADDDGVLRAADAFARAGFTDLILMPRGGGVERLKAIDALLPRLRDAG